MLRSPALNRLRKRGLRPMRRNLVKAKRGSLRQPKRMSKPPKADRVSGWLRAGFQAELNAACLADGLLLRQERMKSGLHMRAAGGVGLRGWCDGCAPACCRKPKARAKPQAARFIPLLRAISRPQNGSISRFRGFAAIDSAAKKADAGAGGDGNRRTGCLEKAKKRA